MRELLLLKIRNLIAAREFIAERARFETVCRDGWSRDWSEPDQMYAEEIDSLLKDAEAMNEQPALFSGSNAAEGAAHDP
jgi:hypothetical protein